MAKNRSRSRQAESSRVRKRGTFDTSLSLNLPLPPLYTPPFAPSLTKFLTTAHVRPPEHIQANAVPPAPASHTHYACATPTWARISPAFLPLPVPASPSPRDVMPSTQRAPTGTSAARKHYTTGLKPHVPCCSHARRWSQRVRTGPVGAQRCRRAGMVRFCSSWSRPRVTMTRLGAGVAEGRGAGW
jgi:hypothetical protein